MNIFVDNRKRKRESSLVKKYDYPVYPKQVIAEDVKIEIEKRNSSSIDFKSEFKCGKEEEVLYDINKFEIYYSDNTTKNAKGTKKSSPNRYDYIHKIDSKKHEFYVQGIITKPAKSKFYNQLIVAKISEYSLQYGDKSEWSLWIKIANKEWFRLMDPYELYSKYFSPTLYRFKVVMFSTQLIEKEKKCNGQINYSKLEKHLEKSIKEYDHDDIVYIKDEVFKHVKEFLDLPSDDEAVVSLDKEMNETLRNFKSGAVSGQVFIVQEFKPPPPQNGLEKIQTDVAKETKKFELEMKACFTKRLNSNVVYSDVEEDKFERIPVDLDINSINCIISNLTNSSELKEYYLGDRELDGVKAGYGYNYDFDYNYDEDPTKTTVDIPIKESTSIEEKEKYLNKRDVLEFARLPKETITYKRYESLYLDSGSIQQHSFNFKEDPNQDLLPFLVCRVCGVGKHIIGANCDTHQKLDIEMSQSIQEYISHLDKHRLESLKSISKKERETTDKALVFNSHLNRSKIENMEANALLQLYSETTPTLTKSSTSTSTSKVNSSSNSTTTTNLNSNSTKRKSSSNTNSSLSFNWP